MIIAYKGWITTVTGTYFLSFAGEPPVLRQKRKPDAVSFLVWLFSGTAVK